MEVRREVFSFFDVGWREREMDREKGGIRSQRCLRFFQEARVGIGEWMKDQMMVAARGRSVLEEVSFVAKFL